MREAVPLTIDDGLQVVHNKRKRRDRQCDNHEIAKAESRWALDNFSSSSSSTNTPTLRFLQWNILSADLVDGFETVDYSIWTAEHREEQLQRHILQVAPDIVCLQEVKATGGHLSVQSISRCLSNQLLQLACFVPKKHKRDGVAVFYRPHKFQLLSTVAIPLYTEDSESQVACLATFESRSDSFLFHVVSTHLKSKIDRIETRSRQVDSLLRTLRDWNLDNENSLVILCGDLNADPGEVAIQKIQSFGFQWIYQQMEEEEEIGNPRFYSTSKKRLNERHSIRMLDYIFVKSSRQCCVICKACLLPPRIGCEGDAVWIPNQEYPSDHWDVVADLFFE